MAPRLTVVFAIRRRLREYHRVVMTLVALTSVLCLQVSAHGEERLVRIGERRLSINCAGEHSNNTTVVLMPGGGEPARNWAKVLAKVATFAHVCSYDPAGSGHSDKTTEPQSAEELVEDLQSLLQAAGEKKPYVLVAHSLAGIIARRFATRFPDEAAAFVFVDSTHEEQAWRLHEIDPGGPPLSDKVARMGFFITPGERLAWRTDLPIIVLARGKPFARTGQLTEEQFAKWDKIWARLQEDLAAHSPKGQYRRASNSGHFINLDEPELVVQAIRDVLPHPPRVNGRTIDTILEPGKDWELLGQGFHLTADFTVDKNGNIYFTDSPRNWIYKIDRSGRIAVWKENSGGAHGIMFGPDDRLYLCQHDRKRIIAYAPDSKESVVAEGVQTHHLAVTQRNEVYFTEPPKHSIWFVDEKGNKRVVSSEIDWPRSVRLSPDQSRLVVDDPHRDSVWSFQVQPDGSLSHGEPFCRLQRSDDSSKNDPGGMAFDTQGLLYIEQMLLSGESETVEFREKLDRSRPERLARTAAAFANTKGGTIVFGVDDDHRVVGCAIKAQFVMRTDNLGDTCYFDSSGHIIYLYENGTWRTEPDTAYRDLDGYLEQIAASAT